MILACLIIMETLLVLLTGYLIGYNHRYIMRTLKKLQKPIEKAEVGAINPYHVVNENKVFNDMDKKRVGAVLPKSPQLLEWEEQEAIRKMNETSV